MFPEYVKNFRAYRALTYDITMEDIAGADRYARMRDTRAYRFVSDWQDLRQIKSY